MRSGLLLIESKTSISAIYALPTGYPAVCSFTSAGSGEGRAHRLAHGCIRGAPARLYRLLARDRRSGRRGKMRLRARAKGMDRVVFTGFVEGAALRAWYRAADVLAFPTLGDAYGLVVLEAMACGLPVISTTAAGNVRTGSSTARRVTSYLPATQEPLPDGCGFWPPIRNFEAG